MMTLQHPGVLNIFGLALSGTGPASPLGLGNLVTAVDRTGNIVAAMAVDQVGTDNFSSFSTNFRFGGMGVSGFQYYGEETQVLIPATASNDTLVEKLVLPEHALVVVMGLSGGVGNTIVLGGIPGLLVDAEGTGGNWTGVIIGHARINSGTYNVTETQTLHPGGTSQGEVLGIFAFSDSQAGFVDRLVPIRLVGSIGVAESPYNEVYDRGKGEIFVISSNDFNPLGNSYGNVSVINDTNDTVVATIPAGNYPAGIAYDSGTGEVFVADTGNYPNFYGNVTVINDTSNTVVAAIPVGPDPTAIAYDEGKGEVFVFSYGAEGYNFYTASIIDDRTNKLVATVSLAGGPSAAAYDHGTGEVFVTEGSNISGDTGNLPGQVQVISDSTEKVVANITVGVSPSAVGYDSRKGEIFVVNTGSAYRGDQNVSVINDTSNRVLASVTVGTYPVAVAYDPDLSELFVTNQASGNLSVISDSSNEVVTTVGLGVPTGIDGLAPIGVVYDGAKAEVFAVLDGISSVMVLSTSTPIEVNTSKVTIRTVSSTGRDIADATVSYVLDGEMIKVGNPTTPAGYTSGYFANGTYPLFASATGFLNGVGTVTVQGNAPPPLTITMTPSSKAPPPTYKLTIEVTTARTRGIQGAWANYTLDGSSAKCGDPTTASGYTSCYLGIGIYAFTFSAHGYETDQQDLGVSGTTLAPTVELVPSMTNKLTIEVNTPDNAGLGGSWANYTVGGVVSGCGDPTTPAGYTSCFLTNGTYSFTIAASGYVSQTVQIVVRGTTVAPTVRLAAD